MQIDQLKNFQDSETETQVSLKLRNTLTHTHTYMIEGIFHVSRERAINNLISGIINKQLKLYPILHHIKKQIQCELIQCAKKNCKF